MPSLNCYFAASFKSLAWKLWEKLRRHEPYYAISKSQIFQVNQGYVNYQSFMTFINMSSLNSYFAASFKPLSWKYSRLSLSRPRLSRITAYLEVKIWSLLKHENQNQVTKYCGKEEKLLRGKEEKLFLRKNCSVEKRRKLLFLLFSTVFSIHL